MCMKVSEQGGGYMGCVELEWSEWYCVYAKQLCSQTFVIRKLKYVYHLMNKVLLLS